MQEQDVIKILQEELEFTDQSIDKLKMLETELLRVNAKHNFIAKSSNNALINELIDDLRRRTAMFDHERLPNRKKPGSKEHLDIIDALEKGDGALASARMARHINNVHSSIFEHWGFNK